MDIKLAVAERLASSGETIKQSVIDLMCQEMLAKRVAQIISAMTEFDNVNQRIRKIKPDNVFYNFEGTKIHESYEKKTLEELSKLSSRQEQISLAVSYAIENSNFEKLDKLGQF